VLGTPACAVTHADYYPLQIFSTILGGGMSSRLFQEVREKRGLAYTVSSYVTGYKDCGLMGIYAGTTPEHVTEMLVAVREVLASMLEGVTDDELLRAKNQMKSGIVMTRENVGSIAEWMARHMHVYGRVKSAEEILEAISAVTAADILRVAKTYIPSDYFAITALGPLDDLHISPAGLPVAA
jgi:predicted Zn-dependent peptidase